MRCQRLVPSLSLPARTRRLAVAVALVGLILDGKPRSVRAETGPMLRVAVTESEGWTGCPSPPELLAALARALPPTDTLQASTDPASEVRLRDLGAELVVQVAGQRRRFSDPLRRCAERARAAAVFVSLALHPPGLPGEPPPPVELPPPRRRPRVGLEVAGLVGASAGGADPLLAAGGALRLYVGGSRVGASLGIHGLAPQRQGIAAGIASALVVPVDLSLRVGVARRRVELSGELGVILAGLRLAAEPDPSRPDPTFQPAPPVWRFDVGLRAAADLRIPVHPSVAPLIGVDFWLWPRPYQLAIEPQGVLAERPLFTIVGRLGLAFRLR